MGRGDALELDPVEQSDLDRTDMGAYEFTNVKLEISGVPTSGGTLEFLTDGTPGLATVMLAGLRPAVNFVPTLGYFAVDPASSFLEFPWPAAPSVVVVQLPSGIPPGTTLVCQEAAFASSGVGNLSNFVEVYFQ